MFLIPISLNNQDDNITSQQTPTLSIKDYFIITEEGKYKYILCTDLNKSKLYSSKTSNNNLYKTFGISLSYLSS